MDAQSLLDVQNVSFSYVARYLRAPLQEREALYGKHKILDNVSFNIGAGEIVALLGENGEGKSTLLNIITAFLKPQSGQVSINRRDVYSFSLRERAQRIAYILQHAPAIPDFYTVRDFIIEGRRAYRRAGHYTKDDYKMADDILARCKLLQYASFLVNDLSGGELQRLVFAQSLMKDAAIYLFDEPCSALDIRHQKEFFALTKAMVTGRARCVLFSIHDINLAMHNATRILLLNGGSISFDGSPDDITCVALESAFQTKITVFDVDGEKYYRW